jgi:hypothetical protein
MNAPRCRICLDFGHLENLGPCPQCDPDRHAEYVVELASLGGPSSRLRRRFRGPRPPIVCLCGSTRFREAWVDAELRLGLAGAIVLTVASAELGLAPGERLAVTEAVKPRLDELHKRKIDLADAVLVLNVGGYIGESTRSEIAYAKEHDRPVLFLDPRRIFASRLVTGRAS